MRPALTCTILALLTAPLQATELPDAIAAPGETLVTTAYAVGTQVYQCEFDTAGNLIWQFREPIAALFVSGKTVGRHYAGPTWGADHGSVVMERSSGAPASTADIPILNLEVTRRGVARSASIVSTIRRLPGGVAVGECSAHHPVGRAYTADYAFYRKSSATHAAMR
jgi:hypothetical protein